MNKNVRNMWRFQYSVDVASVKDESIWSTYCWAIEFSRIASRLVEVD